MSVTPVYLGSPTLPNMFNHRLKTGGRLLQKRQQFILESINMTEVYKIYQMFLSYSVL